MRHWCLAARSGNAQFTRPGQDRVLQAGRCVVAGIGIEPFAALVSFLAKHRDADAVGAKFATENIDGDLEAFTRAFRWRVPVCDDDAAKRIGGGQGQKRNRIERGAPEESVDANATVGVRIVVPAEQIEVPEKLPALLGQFFALAIRVPSLARDTLAGGQAQNRTCRSNTKSATGDYILDHGSILSPVTPQSSFRCICEPIINRQ